MCFPMPLLQYDTNKSNDTQKTVGHASPVQTPYDGRARSKELDGSYIVVVSPLRERF